MSDSEEEQTEIIVNGSDEDETSQISEKPKEVERTKTGRKKKVMTQQMRDQLALARKKGMEKRMENAQAKRKVKEIKEYKINEVKTESERYEKIKDKVKEDLSVNNWDSIQKHLENINLRMSKFDQYVEEKKKHRQEKTTRETLRELPQVVSEGLLKEQLKQYELDQFKRRVFGC